MSSEEPATKRGSGKSKNTKRLALNANNYSILTEHVQGRNYRRVMDFWDKKINSYLKISHSVCSMD